MVSTVEAFRMALASIRSHGLRSMLTMLGIIIGVASIITVIALGEAMSRAVDDNFKGLGSNSITIKSYTSPEDAARRKVNRLTLGDYRQLVHNISGISAVSPSFAPWGEFGTTLRNGQHSAVTAVTAVTPRYREFSQSYPQRGRYIMASDDAMQRKVCVIGPKLREKLKLPPDPVGKFIQIGAEWFKIVGLLEARGEVFGVGQDDFVVIPFGTGLAQHGSGTPPDLIITLNVDNGEQFAALQDRITALLRQLHRLQPEQRNDFEIITASQLRDAFASMIRSMTIFLGGIVGISLLVGGIGIMNVMLISVTERTREIGIRKALGARRRDILIQFLFEAIVLALLGGLLGVVLGYLFTLGLGNLTPSIGEMAVPLRAIATGLLFSSAVGLLFGVLPAAKASRLDPIKALHFE